MEESEQTIRGSRLEALPPIGQIEGDSAGAEAHVDASETETPDEEEATSAPKRHKAGIFSNRELPEPFIAAVLELEKQLNMQVWLLVQGGDEEEDMIGPTVADLFLLHKHDLPRGEQIALIIDSRGGLAMSAYKIAELLRRRCGGFTAVVPRYAKSAATLLVLGAHAIILGEDGELGPLDAQISDPDRETRNSALDEVQSLERLHAFAMKAVHQAMVFFLGKTGKRIDVLLPMILKFVADEMRPLLEDIDAVRYTQRSRDLKVASEYAERLLHAQYGPDNARSIASSLVENYPEHGFPIHAREASSIGLSTVDAADEVCETLDRLVPMLLWGGLTVIGRVTEVEDNDD